MLEAAERHVQAGAKRALPPESGEKANQRESFSARTPMRRSLRCRGFSRSSRKGRSSSSASAHRASSLVHASRPVRERAKVMKFSKRTRSEEHTSELQSLAYLVCRLLLEKKKIRKAHILITNDVRINHICNLLSKYWSTLRPT